MRMGRLRRESAVGIAVSLWVGGCGAGGPSGSASPAPTSAPASTSRATLYVANQDDATLSVIDLWTLRVERTLDLRALGFSANARPHHLVFEPDGSFGYVSLIGDNRVVKLDRSDRVVGSVEFGTPGMLALDADARRMFVGRSMSAVNPPQRIGSIDPDAMEVEEIDVLFPRPHAVALTPDGSEVYTASLSVNQLAAVEVVSEAVDLTDVPGDMMHTIVQFAVSPDGSTMVGTGEMTGAALIFDLARPNRPRLAASVRVGARPWHPVISPDGRFAYFANKGADAVTVLDLEAQRVDAVVQGRGLSEPHGAVLSDDGRWLYVTNNNLQGTYRGGATGDEPVGTLVVIDTEARAIHTVIEVGRGPTGLAIRRGGG